MNTIVKNTLSDLLTVSNIATEDNYLDFLLDAISTYNSLKINTKERYTAYSNCLESLKPFSFEQMFFLERMKNSHYKSLIINTYAKLINKIVYFNAKVQAEEIITNEDVLNVISDLKTIQRISANPELIEQLKSATNVFKSLNINSIEMYYSYQPYIDTLKNISYEEIGFVKRINEKEYREALKNIYLKITGRMIILPEKPKIIKFPQKQI